MYDKLMLLPSLSLKLKRAKSVEASKFPNEFRPRPRMRSEGDNDNESVTKSKEGDKLINNEPDRGNQKTCMCSRCPF